MISIVKRPYDGQWSNHNPVYNGLNFIVDSDRKLSSQFRYIAEIYAGSSATNLIKVGELRHNPDISYNNQGVFDVGRVLEDFITYNLAWNALGVNDNSNHYKTYYVDFGEEYGRTMGITLIKNQSGKFFLSFNVTHNLQPTYSSILIQGTSLGAINKPFAVLSTPSSTSVTINYSFQSGVSYANAYVIQGAYANNGMMAYTGADGGTYYMFQHAGTGKDAAYADTGDGIQVFCDDPNINFLGGTYQILEKYYDSNQESFIYKTNIPYVSNMNGIPVHIFPTGPIQMKQLLSTRYDQASTWNAVFQYEDILDYNSKPFAPYQKNTNVKFLTDRPRTTQGNLKMNLCLSDYYSVGYLANYGMPSNGGSLTRNLKGLLVEVWTKSNPAPVSTNAAGAISRAGTTPNTLWNYVAIKVPGNETSNYTRGSYITLQWWQLVGTTWTSYTTQQRVIGSAVTPGGTNIFIDLLYNTNMNNSTLRPWTITCTQRVILRTDQWDISDENSVNRLVKVRLENGIGPKNLALNNYQEFQTNDVKKYFVTLYGFDNQLASNRLNSCYYKNTAASETWEITVTDCPCEAYKTYTLFWMNKLGGWDYYNFTARTDKTRNIEERAQFRRTLYNYGTFVNGQKGQSTYNTLATDEWTLNTDWLTQGEIDWIQDIYESPEVYIILKDHTNDFIKTKPATFDPSAVKDIIKPVNLTDEQVVLANKKNRGDKGGLFQYKLTARAANRREIQRGSNYGGNYFYNRS
jgi:hypothetical protein